MQTRRRLLLLALVGVWLGGFDAVSAAPARLAILCEDVCGGGGASCGDECWLTQFDFDQEYPPTTCGAESYSCCGDDFCDVAVEGCSSAACGDDCGGISVSCGGGGPCGSGEVENGSNECVFSAPEVPKGSGTCGGECASNDNCCGNDYCNSGYCAIPSTTYCPESPPCSGTDGTNSWDNCNEWKALYCSTAADLYCDPGINRCQFVASTDCPVACAAPSESR